jgi:hypothetical protein
MNENERQRQWHSGQYRSHLPRRLNQHDDLARCIPAAKMPSANGALYTSMGRTGSPASQGPQRTCSLGGACWLGQGAPCIAAPKARGLKARPIHLYGMVCWSTRASLLRVRGIK